MTIRDLRTHMEGLSDDMVVWLSGPVYNELTGNSMAYTAEDVVVQPGYGEPDTLVISP
jgi:hypothetical protein